MAGGFKTGVLLVVVAALVYQWVVNRGKDQPTVTEDVRDEYDYIIGVLYIMP